MPSDFNWTGSQLRSKFRFEDNLLNLHLIRETEYYDQQH